MVCRLFLCVFADQGMHGACYGNNLSTGYTVVVMFLVPQVMKKPHGGPVLAEE